MADRKLKIHSKGELVRTLQALLNRVLVPSPNLPLKTTFGPETQRAVIAFQTSRNLQRHDGTVDTETWHALRDELGDNFEMLHQFSRRMGRPDANPFQVPGWLAGISVPSSRRVGDFEFNRRVFFEMFDDDFEMPNPAQAEGLNDLLERFENDSQITDTRVVAYMLATVKIECDNKWKPVTEKYNGDPVQYFNNKYGTRTDIGNTQPGDGYKYRGRGFVQITGRATYTTLDNDLGMGGRLVANPDLALDADTAYSIMSAGMRKGLFTGRAVGHYIHDDHVDYRHARQVINKMDRADEIAGYAKTFEAILNASWRFIPAPSPLYQLAPF